MNSSAVDARLVIALEKILDAGSVIYSEKTSTGYHFKITTYVQGVTVNAGIEYRELGESFDGFGKTFTQAFNNAYNQLPERTAEFAA